MKIDLSGEVKRKKLSERRIYQYRLFHLTEYYIVKAYSKMQIRDHFRISGQGLKKRCLRLEYDEKRKIDCDLIAKDPYWYKPLR